MKTREQRIAQVEKILLMVERSRDFNPRGNKRKYGRFWRSRQHLWGSLSRLLTALKQTGGTP